MDLYVKQSAFPGCFVNGVPTSEAAALAAEQLPLAESATGETLTAAPSWETILSWAIVGPAPNRTSAPGCTGSIQPARQRTSSPTPLPCTAAALAAIIDELSVCIDAALMWARWALRRLNALSRQGVRWELQLNSLIDLVAGSDALSKAARSGAMPAQQVLDRTSLTARSARIAVGRSIRRALAVIENADPVICEHLRSAIHTGARWWYRPA